MSVSIPAAALAQTPAAVAPDALAYPTTDRVDVVEEPFGVRVADPYRWLENDVREDQRVREWVTAQNAVTDRYLATLPGRDAFAQRMKQLFDYERYGVPRKAGGRYFFLKNDGLQNQLVLYVRERLDGPDRMLIDPNTWAKDGATALAEWAASDDGKRLAYAVQDGGSDWRTIRLLDVDSGQVLADEVKWVKFSSIAWKKDGSGFFYSRFAEPAKGEAFQSLNTDQTVYFHRVGTPQSEDAKVFATPAHPKRGHSAQVTDDGKYLLITSSEGTDDRYELHVARLDGAAIEPRMLVEGLEHNWQLAGSTGSTFYFVTNQGAPRQRLVSIDVEKRSSRPKELVAEAQETLEGASLVGDRLVLAWLGDAKSEATLHDLKGRMIAPVRLPDIGTAVGFGGEAGDPETFFAFSSFATPATVYRFDTASGETQVFAAPKVAFDPADYATEQRFYTSKDGTRVPMFVVRRKDVTGPAPTILYGYGGFNVSVTPSFSATRLAWLEQGGVLAVANLRGGGEYGKAWHDAGRLANKQNVFDDFIAAGEYLIAHGMTPKDGLVAQGGSNGGLLVGAAVNQRPDLFAAALPAVGVMDMLRFDRFTAGRYWVDDYGYPSKEADFKALHAYSPYHNIRERADYPAILVTTADTDDRVVPGHSFKYAAAIQHADLGERPRLIRIETRAGHGSGKPTDKIIDEAADLWAFAAKWTGLHVKPALDAGTVAGGE